MEQVAVTEKKKAGRPPKPPGQKREAALMLRLNVIEKYKLYEQMREKGWTGDPSSFVRDLITSKRRGQGVGVDAVALEHSMSLLNAVLDDLEDTMTEEQREFIGQIKAVMNKAAQAIYATK